MDAKQFLQYAFDKAGYQLKMVFEGVGDLDAKPLSSVMSPREQLAHLWEVYQAIQTTAAGEKHPWGEFVIPESIKANALTECFAAREAACAVILTLEDEAAQKMGLDFVLEHDCYHVGQMCAVRLALDSGWNAYSIYNH